MTMANKNGFVEMNLKEAMTMNGGWQDPHTYCGGLPHNAFGNQLSSQHANFSVCWARIVDDVALVATMMSAHGVVKASKVAAAAAAAGRFLTCNCR